MSGPRDLRAFQQHIEAIFGERDRARGIAGTYMWFVEEVGELGRALRKGDTENLREEVSDVLAWLCTLASMRDIDISDAVERYDRGCPRCHAVPCGCQRGRARS